MTPERWQQIDELFNAALACEPAQRAEFLAANCAGDESLRREVESLLSSLEGADGFIETSASDIAAELLRTHSSTYEPGQQIQNFQIVRHLGSGGMGEVHLAKDLRLNRNVALKLLPPHFMLNPDRVRRFEREARAASALNHPNIVTIYEIGRSSSIHFIATEFVDGKTLRQLINEKPLTLNETLNVCIQVADALSGAHAAGIVHRDIKPENIMIRQDGFVKILDFGLAKLTEHQATDVDLEQPTLLQTNPGLVMGTVQYMSPEQARARNVGPRTDIWSLGIVMYEVLAGHVPFSGETPSHVMVSLMEDKLPPLRERANVPAELDQFISKALRKNQKERYQTAGQFGRDLKNLKNGLERDATLNVWLKTIPSHKDGTQQLPPLSPLTTVGGAHWVSIENRAAAETTEVESHPTSSADYLVRKIKSRRTLAMAASVILVFGAIGLIYLIRNRFSSNPTSKTVAANPAQKRGTTNEEAYAVYLQGRNLMKQRNQPVAAREHFKEAIRLDPNFALAYAWIANANHSIAMFTGDARPENEKAKVAIKKALELDSNLSEAYTFRALIHLTYDYDFTAAETDSKRALELDPKSDLAHWVNSLVMVYTGRFDEALKEMETVHAIAPGTVMYERERARILYLSRRYDEAIIEFKRTTELRANSRSPDSWIIRAHEMKGDQAGAYYWFIRWYEALMSNYTDEYRKAYETGGWPRLRRKLVEVVKLKKDYFGMYDYELAGHLILLGETTEAFSYLTQAVEKREWGVVMLNIDPVLDGVRGDPRFAELVKRANFR